METDTFTPTFTGALLENAIVFICIVLGAPFMILARKASHPSVTVPNAVTAGLVGGVILFLYYTVRFVLRVPAQIVVSETSLLLRWRNRTETCVRWEDVRRAVFRQRWGYRWKLFLDDSISIVWGDGLSDATWERMSGLIEAQLNSRGVPIEKYNLSGKRVV